MTFSPDPLLQLRDVSITYQDFSHSGRDPLITDNGLPGRLMGKQIDLNVNADILTYGFWENRVHSMTDETVDGPGQFRVVGWNYRIGVHVSKYLDVYYEHFSRHLLDTTYPTAFPVQDSFGIKLRIFELNSPRQELF